MTETNASLKVVHPSQNKRLEELISMGALVSVYLINGIHLRGHILGFDAYTILLRVNMATKANCQLIYKHAISTIAVNTSPNNNGAP